MIPDENAGNTLQEYREYELTLHGELMNVCRRYINRLGIVSILGILEIVKQETIELEQATRRDIKLERNEANE